MRKRKPPRIYPKLTETELAEYVYQSNGIEGYTPDKHSEGDLLFDNHVLAARLAEDFVWLPKLLHGTLMKGVLFGQYVGEYRDVPVLVGGQFAARPASLFYRMRDWETMVKRGPQDESAERFAWRMHDHFECIHPFIDSNGRTGRLVLNALRLTHGLPWLTIHVGDEQMKYYEHIQKYRDEHFEP